MQPVNFMIPGLYENFKINKFFISLMKENPQCFIDGATVRAVYGNFQFCTWDGGRTFPKQSHSTLEEIEEIRDYFNNQNIPIRLVFTNPLLTIENCFDRYNNLVLSLCENDINEVIINSPILEQYIRTNYPKFKFISSTTKCITNAETLKAELNNPNYELVCFDYNLNHNKKLLESLNEEEKRKSELLINAICPIGCPNRKNHYDLNGLYYLNYGKPFKLSACPIDDVNLHPDAECHKTHLTFDEIQDYYLPLGYNNFKLEGRTFSEFTHFCNCVNFMVKPKYQTYILSLYEYYRKEQEQKNVE